jgi:predicted component of type VI protein secretion system
MFLERKFSRPRPDAPHKDPPLCPALPAADWSRLPELVYDVVCNLQLLLASRRGYSHVLPDFGLSASNGQHGIEARVEVLQAQLPAMLARYEPRFRLDEVDVEVDDAGAPQMKVSGELLLAPGAFTFRFGIISRKLLSFDYEPRAAE